MSTRFFEILQIDLAKIEGVSPELASSIVALRSERGRLGSVEALRILPGADDSSLDALRRNTTLDLPVRRGGKNYKTVDQVMSAFAGEPDIRAVQSLAMDYSHTHANQVERWLAQREDR